MLRQLLLLLITTSFFSSCSENTNSFEVKKDKVYPYYDRDIERAFPDSELDVKAFIKGKKQVKEDMQQTSRRIAGFDKEWTIQGPGNIGARVNSVAINPNNENIIYAGFAGGGLWKTTDGGEEWNVILDTELMNSIAHITLDHNNPDIVYVATGDPNIPGLSYIGDGIYRSEDAGETWENIGLAENRIISKIRIDPNNSDVLYAASMGLPFTKNDTRGLYKSIDRGQNWNKIFEVSDSTGVTDFQINPGNPEIMYAATWDRVRNYDQSLVSGDGSGIYYSENGGVDWQMPTGIPDTTLNRTGISICENQPNYVYAITVGTDSEISAIYRSEDFGKNYTEIPTDFLRNSGVLGGFGWYFGKIKVDPDDPDHIYVLGVNLWETYNVGESWTEAAPPWFFYDVHADKHDLQIMESGNMYLATDGGVYAKSPNEYEWRDIENIPTTQFYRVAYNPHEPNQYYGGAQDNGTTSGSIDEINEWERMYGGDGFQAVFSPTIDGTWFCETQRGNIVQTINFGQDYSNATAGLNGEKNWDMPYMLSPHLNAMYAGTDSLYINTNHIVLSPEWIPISGNLANPDFVESQLSKTITTIDESPVKEGLVYVGTSSGYVYNNKEGQTEWTRISDELPERYITSVKASPTEEGTAYVTLSGYKYGEFIPRVYQTDDYGSTWFSIGDGLPDIAVNDIYILPSDEEDLIFVATDGGVYGTIDGAQTWERLGLDMPNIVSYDMEYNPSNNELIVGTFGRSIMTYSLEDIYQQVSNTKTLISLETNVYPNPTSDFITIEIKDKFQSLTINIVNSLGQTVKQVLLQREKTIISLDGLANGNYFIIGNDKDSRVLGRFVKI